MKDKGRRETTDEHRYFSRKAFACRVISIFFTNLSYLCPSVVSTAFSRFNHARGKPASVVKFRGKIAACFEMFFRLSVEGLRTGKKGIFGSQQGVLGVEKGIFDCPQPLRTPQKGFFDCPQTLRRSQKGFFDLRQGVLGVENPFFCHFAPKLSFLF
ncbi:MAG: hypothetical protein H0X66_17570 [Verrucomicrobia bacterium]|nr:hypothetical protein [Verrucomicrobiota bacterium]